MKFAVLQFPGSNCDQDCYHALKHVFGQDTRYVWHKETSLDADDVIFVPGGFSYGDYLRCGAIARFSPVMEAVKKAAARGQLVIGICNGFQILCESGLLPGALVRNRSLHFRCEHVPVRVETIHSPFTSAYITGETLSLPIAHGEGCYTASEDVLEELFTHNQVIFRYTDPEGRINDAGNPNGSARNIAGICNRDRNVLGMMPHPERACETILGGTDGRGLFESILRTTGLFCPDYQR
jgi:phosphoribosylformylglycinamidine synthase